GVIEEIIHRYTGNIIMHNAKFDIHFLEREKVDVRRSRVHDSRIASVLVDNVQSAALKSLSARIIDHDAFGPQHAMDEAMRANGWSWATVPYELPSYWEYSALDPVLTQRIWNHQKPKLQEFNNIYNMELAVQQVLIDMENRGIRVDLDYCQRSIDALEGTIADLEARADYEFGVKH